MPRISAIITTFNRADMLKHSIKSVLSQSYDDYELLILDNSSKDETQEVVKSFSSAKIRYIRHAPMTIPKARNLGVKESRGEFIAFLDDDDEWLPCKLKAEIDVFDNAGSDGRTDKLALSYGGYIEMDSASKDIGSHKPVLRGSILRELLFQEDGFTGSASNPMLRKSVVEELGGYNEDVPTGEDWELYLRLAQKYEIDYTDEPVVRIRAHAGVRLGDNLSDAAMLELSIMKMFPAIFNSDKKLKSFYLQKIGGKFIREGNMGKGRGYIAKAIKAYPGSKTAYVQYISSMMGRKFYHKLHSSYIASKKNKQRSQQ